MQSFMPFKQWVLKNLQFDPKNKSSATIPVRVLVHQVWSRLLDIYKERKIREIIKRDIFIAIGKHLVYNKPTLAKLFF